MAADLELTYRLAAAVRYIGERVMLHNGHHKTANLRLRCTIMNENGGVAGRFVRTSQRRSR
jgi:hypothetical protein